MKRTLKLLILLFVALGFFASNQAVRAFDPTQCTYDGQCVQNETCYSPCGGGCGVWVANGPCGSAVVGGIKPPEGVQDYNTIAMMGGGGGNAIGVFAFISVGLRLFTIISGLFILFNFLIAGYTLIASAGNSQKYTDVRERLTFALIGLVIIVAAYMLAAMIGLIFFGDATFILQPNISQYSALSP